MPREGVNPFDVMEARARVSDPPPGGSRIKEYVVTLPGGDQLKRVLAECAGDAARLFVQSNTTLTELALEVGSITVHVSGPDTDGLEDYRIEARSLIMFTTERLNWR